MEEILKKIFRTKNIISLCINKVDWDKRIIGYIKSINSSEVIIDVVDRFGNVIKSKNITISRIVIIEVNDSYNKHLEKLKNQAKNFKKMKSFYYYNKGNDFIEKIEQLRSSANICTIFFGAEYLTGIIKSFDKSSLSINSIGYRGTKEGESYCKLKNITKIRYDGPLEAKINYLQNKI